MAVFLARSRHTNPARCYRPAKVSTFVGRYHMNGTNHPGQGVKLHDWDGRRQYFKEERRTGLKAAARGSSRLKGLSFDMDAVG